MIYQGFIFLSYAEMGFYTMVMNFWSHVYFCSDFSVVCVHQIQGHNNRLKYPKYVRYGHLKKKTKERKKEKWFDFELQMNVCNCCRSACVCYCVPDQTFVLVRIPSGICWQYQLKTVKLKAHDEETPEVYTVMRTANVSYFSESFTVIQYSWINLSSAWHSHLFRR